MGAEMDPTKVYMISTPHMAEGIELYLDPVVRDVQRVAGTYRAAHDQAKAAHDQQTPGWFGGEGNGHVRPAISTFLNEVVYQVGELAGDQEQLAASLQNYREALVAHIDKAVRTDLTNADRFLAIHRELDAKREW
ncbi:hypothetical protein [Actinophytocola sp. NPDC049390]|uniref:hypothetical protein n=1 Tax=Actinophytocola sp. NPDC049390 TaxID=3363894 RepID=UPI00379D5F73